MDKMYSKEEEVRKKEITINEMVEENQEDRTEVPATKEIQEDNLKDTTDLNRDNLKDTTDLIPTKENLGRNLTAVNHVLSQTAGIKANQKKK